MWCDLAGDQTRLIYFETSIKRLNAADIYAQCLCPGFSWDRVNFLSSSWYSAMSWIQCEKNVDNTLMFSVVAK